MPYVLNILFDSVCVLLDCNNRLWTQSVSRGYGSKLWAPRANKRNRVYLMCPSAPTCVKNIVIMNTQNQLPFELFQKNYHTWKQEMQLVLISSDLCRLFGRRGQAKWSGRGDQPRSSGDTVDISFTASFKVFKSWDELLMSEVLQIKIIGGWQDMNAVIIRVRSTRPIQNSLKWYPSTFGTSTGGQSKYHHF